MAYVDAQFNSPSQEGLVGTPNNCVSLGTATGATVNFVGTAGSAAGNGVFKFPKWVNPTKVNNIRVYIGTAPASNVTALLFTFLNGTNTVGLCTVGTHTAGEVLDASLTALSTDSHGVVTGPTLFTSTGGEMTVTVTGTATASGQALGSYAVDVVLGNLFTT